MFKLISKYVIAETISFFFLSRILEQFPISIKNSQQFWWNPIFYYKKQMIEEFFENSWWLFWEFLLENQIASFQNRYIIQYSFANFKFLRWFWIWTNPRMIFFAKVTRCWSLHTYIFCCQNLYFMRWSSHIWSAVIGVKYWNCCQTLDVYLGFAIWLESVSVDLRVNRISAT